MEGVHLNGFGCVEGIYFYEEAITNAKLESEIGKISNF